MLSAAVSLPSFLPLVLGAMVIGLGAYAVYRQVDVRLALVLAALALGVLAGNVQAVVRKFLETFADEKFVVPICTAMGFAYALRHTGCDRHLVHLLTRPLVRVRPLLIPGTVLVGFLVNMPIVSQTSTAVATGPVVIPILQAARLSPVTIGAAVLLGCSIGGELFNPAAPELRTTVKETNDAANKQKRPDLEISAADCVARIFPLNMLGLAVGTGVFWFLSLRAERRSHRPEGVELGEAAAGETKFRVSLLQAVVPLVPLLMLFLTSGPLKTVAVERDWLVPAAADRPADPEREGKIDSRWTGLAMLVGVAAAALAVPRRLGGVMGAFFEGAGYGFVHIVSLIIAASCFAEGVKGIGLAKVIGQLIGHQPGLLFPAAGLLPLGFAALSGSGMAATQGLVGFFIEPALQLGMDPAQVGAVVSLASAAGRTMSPVAAVTLMTADLTGTTPWQLVRRLAVPLLAGTAAIVVAAMIMAPRP